MEVYGERTHILCHVPPRKPVFVLCLSNQIGAAARAKQKERDAKRTAEKEGYAVSSVDGTDSDDESCHVCSRLTRSPETGVLHFCVRV